MGSNSMAEAKTKWQIPIIIPSYEPDEKLIKLLGELRENGVQNIIIVDDGSGENYAHFFESAQDVYGCKVMHHAVNQGKGRALKTAFDYCLKEFSDYPGVITADSDGQHSPSCILKCAQALIEHPDALIMGCRCFDEKDVPKKSEYGNKLTRKVMKYLTGVSVSDTQTGLRGIPMSFMEDLLRVKGERFEFETNMLLESKSCGVPIVEVPIETIYIEENKTSHFHPFRDSVRISMIFGKFLLSSFSSSIVDLVLFSLFCFLLRDKQWGMITYIMASTVLARILSALYNFIINYRIVFQSRESIWVTLPRYVLLAVVQMTLSALLVNWLYPFFGGAEVLVKIPVDIILFFLSFVIQREFVYAKRNSNTQ